MSLTITPIIAPQNPDIQGRSVIVDGTIALTGSYTVHGDTLNLTQIQPLSSQLPEKVEVWEAPAAGTSPTFVELVFCPGTTQANGLLAMAKGGTELTAETYAAAFPAGVPTLYIRAWFPRY